MSNTDKVKEAPHTPLRPSNVKLRLYSEVSHWTPRVFIRQTVWSKERDTNCHLRCINGNSMLAGLNRIEPIADYILDVGCGDTDHKLKMIMISSYSLA